MKKGVLSAIVVILLAAIIVLVCGIGSSWFTNGDFSTWFNSWGKGEEQEEPADEDDEAPAGDETDEQGGMLIGEGESCGVALMSAKIAAADYAEYGISTMAESAQLLTATLAPEDATCTTAVWSIAFTDAESEWASGKTVTDYVTVSATEENALTATVENLQPFGEQIIITLTVTSENTASATCTVDYAQKVTDVSLALGSDVVFNFSSGQVTVPLQVNKNGTAPGGAAVTSVISNDIYTLQDSFTASYDIADWQDWCVQMSQMGKSSWLSFADYDTSNEYDYSAIENYSIEENGLCFGLQFFVDNLGLHGFNATRSAPEIYEVYDYDSTFWEERFEKVLSSLDEGSYSYNGTHLFDIEVTVTGTYSTYTAVLDVSVGSIVSTSPISDVGLDQDSVVF